jgi:hypothetical protein
MKHVPKVVVSLVLVIVFLVACITLGGMLFIGGWLQTYNALTSKTLLAEVSLSELKKDDDGTYIDVTYTPYEPQQTALSKLLDSGSQTNSVKQIAQSFKVYGDSVHIGGPIVKFHDNLILLNLKTIYKVGVLYGRYDFDNSAELNRKVQSSFTLNGGIDPTWRDLMLKQNDWPYNMFVDYSQLSDPGMPAQTKPTSYKFYINNNGFAFE